MFHIWITTYKFFVERRITILLALAVSLYLSFQQHTIFKNSHSYLIFIGTFITQTTILLVGRHTNALHCRTSGLVGFGFFFPLQYFSEFINLRWDSLHLRGKYLSETTSHLLPAFYRNRHLGRNDSSQESGMTISLQGLFSSHHWGGRCLGAYLLNGDY